MALTDAYPAFTYESFDRIAVAIANNFQCCRAHLKLLALYSRYIWGWS